MHLLTFIGFVLSQFALHTSTRHVAMQERPAVSSTRLLNEGPFNARLIDKWRDCTRTTTCTSSAAAGGAQGENDCDVRIISSIRRLELNRKDRGVPRLAYADAYDTHTPMQAALCEQFVC